MAPPPAVPAAAAPGTAIAKPSDPLAPFFGAINGVLDLIMGPATEEQLRLDAGLEGRSKLVRRKRAKKEDEAPVDLQLKIRMEAEKIAERMKKAEELKAAEDAAKLAASQGNVQQLLTMGLIQIIQLYATSQACLLAVFVPQKCPALQASACPCCASSFSPILSRTRQRSAPRDLYTQDLKDGHLCSMKENLDWFNCSYYNKCVIVINVSTLLCVLSAAGYFWSREIWMVNNLEEDTEKPYNNLPSEVESYPLMKEIILIYNSGAYNIACFMFFMVFANFVASCIFLIYGDGIYNYSLGSRTYTAIVTNTMLVSNKVLAYLSYSRLSWRNKWAVSMFSTLPLSFNTLDENFKIKE